MDHQNDTIKEAFHVAGDAPDPTGTNLRGVAPGYDMTMTAQGHPMILCHLFGKELILEADVYALPGQPRYIHILCPICLANGRTSALRICEDKKALSYDPSEPTPTFPNWTRDQMRQAFPDGRLLRGGRLSVAEFQCSWEESPELRRGFGLSVCPWRVVIENNVARMVG